VKRMGADIRLWSAASVVCAPLFLFRAISGIQSKRGAQTTFAAFPFSGYQRYPVKAWRANNARRFSFFGLSTVAGKSGAQTTIAVFLCSCYSTVSSQSGAQITLAALQLVAKISQICGELQNLHNALQMPGPASCILAVGFGSHPQCLRSRHS